MKILGIDPGYDRTGIAVIEKDGSKNALLHSECFTTDAKWPFYERLVAIQDRILHILEEFKPDALAIETLFITNNQKTGMRVAEARGVIAVAAAERKIPIFEYSPPEIKAAITGDGKSDKAQIIKMIGLLLEIPPRKRHDDEYDAIAVALTCSAIEK
ncbi:MAG: crossover junction endodeoxyribonuclease RuvC [Patescibacteria group bacterium]|nr:crossover junction endodeoxyribonuclease RuvC [Patescibacteria group bacterium]